MNNFYALEDVIKKWQTKDLEKILLRHIPDFEKKYQEKVRTHNLIRQIIQYKKEPSALTDISPTKVKTNEKHTKGYSPSLATREMQIKIIMRPLLTYWNGYNLKDIQCQMFEEEIKKLNPHTLLLWM